MSELTPASPRAPQPREIEWQLASPDLERVRQWLSEHATVAGLAIEPRDTQQLRDTYLDTSDFRIFRAGFALRMRASGRAGEATLKALRSAREDVADRVELSEPLSRTNLATLGRLHGPVGMRVRAVAGREALHELFEVRTRRRRFTVREHGRTIGELTLDETHVCRPGGEERAYAQRVEVEAQGPSPGAALEPLSKLVQTIATECDLHRAAVSKFELGLRSMGLDPFAASPPGPQDAIEGTMRTHDAALTALRQLMADWKAHEPAARLGDDPAELHALRITARRMDAVLVLFARHLPRPLAGVRPVLKTVLRALGQVRDHDLQLENLQVFEEELTAAERAALEPLAHQLEAERTRARKRMLEVLDAPASQASLEKLTRTLARTRPSRPAGPAGSLATTAPGLIRERFRRLRKAHRRLEAPKEAADAEGGAAGPAQAAAGAAQTPSAGPAGPTMEDYHRVRRRAKQLRYALEPVAPLYGKPAQQMLRALRRLQDRLGVQQDANVARTRMARLVSRPPAGFGPLTLYLMGRLAERQGAPAGDTARRVAKAWHKLSGERWKALKRRMEEVQETDPPGSEEDPEAAGEPAGD